MRLTAAEHPVSIERYRQVKPARGPLARRCARRCPGTEDTCTLQKGHRGPHVAHGSFGKVLAVWDPGAVAGPAEGARREVAPRQVASRQGARRDVADPRHVARRRPSPGARGGRPLGLRTGSPVGLVEAFRRRIACALGSLEDIVFLVFFLAFVGFAVHWFLLILG